MSHPKIQHLQARLAEFLRRRPSVRDALLWALPAVLFGALLRLCLLHYMPYGYWGADSRSYFDFSYKLFAEHYLSLVEKRRFFYPIFVAFVTMLPGAPLRWLPWIQHGIGLLTLIPLAYFVRKNFALWKWWVIPITVLYTAHPVILWYEHELLAENIFFSLVIWSFAGWTAWVREPARPRALRLWWLFYVPFALFILTRPAGRFMWPAVLLGLVAVAAWRRVGRPQLISLGALIVATFLVGSKEQGAWLFYTATFPLTQTSTPLHAEYKAEIRELVAKYHADMDQYWADDDEIFAFLEMPRRKPEFKLWPELTGNAKLKTQIYMDLAKEGILAEPLNFLKLGLHRMIVSSNLSNFKVHRFEPRFLDRFEVHYREAEKRIATHVTTPVPLVLGLPAKGPIPPYEEIKQRLNPAPQSAAAHFVFWWTGAYQSHADLFAIRRERVTEPRPTFLGWLLLAGIVLAFLLPGYRLTVGVWALCAVSYISGVMLVTQVNPRYFGAAWPILIPLLFIPLDALASLIIKKRGTAQS